MSEKQVEPEVSAHSELSPNMVSYRVLQIERRLEDLEKQLDEQIERLSERADKFTLWLLGSLLTFCVFLLGIAATLLTAGH